MDWIVPIGLILLGLLLLIAEVFIPSGGVLFVLALVSLIAGITMIFFIPESRGGGVTAGLLTIAIVFVLVPLAVGIAFYYWPKTPFGKRFILAAPQSEEEQPPQAFPEREDLLQLKGQVGRAVSPLRPSGIVVIQGRRVDAETEGVFVDVGCYVRVVDVRPSYVIVRPLGPEETQFLSEASS
jgi:membrane-bound serine protease (ClpP class)